MIIVDLEGSGSTERTFDPQKLKNDPIWKAGAFENPDHVYYGSSTIISASIDTIQVNYQYRTGYHKPFKFWNQQLSYKIDTESLKLFTSKVFEPIEE